MGKVLDFKNMHKKNELLFLPNAWDLLSAIILEQAGFKAIGTTSWGVANAMGYKDGERIQFDDLYALVKKMTAVIEIPVTVDVESGYSDSATIVADNVLKIADLGVVGINIEDSLKTASGLKDISLQCELIAKLKNKLDSAGYGDFFINARVDTYLQKQDPLAETIERASAYVESGADGVFVPGLWQQDEIARLVNVTKAPLNIMSLPNMTNLNGLNELGVRRFSLGATFSDAVIAFIETQAQRLFTEQSTEMLYAHSHIETLFRLGK